MVGGSTLLCWVAARSFVAWRGPEKKQSRHDDPMRHAPCPLRHRRTSPSRARRQARYQTAVVLPSVPTGGPVRGGWVRRAHPPACGAVVVVPGPSSGAVGGVVRSPALAPPCSPGGSGASPGPGGSARRSQVAPRAAPWPSQRLLPCVGGVLRGPGAVGGAAGSARHTTGASRCQVVVSGTVGSRALHLCARCRVRGHLPRSPG